ncbi:MAG: glycosyltransferase family 2 protein, partial [Paracoccus sp. (in: a-proteobacteria)]|nr:glycosyltransferase family 2 protein [Paracoccus sp. (in: a-proteobacteria)]
MNALQLRAIRQWFLGRAIRRRRRVVPVVNRMGPVPKDAILCFVTMRNEMVRLPFFLDYYRNLGVT